MKTLMEELIEETGIRPEILSLVVTRTMAHLHRGFHERCGQNGDYLCGQLPLDLNPEAYLHFLAIVICISEDYILNEIPELAEYGDRVVPREFHNLVLAEVETWGKRELR